MVYSFLYILPTYSCCFGNPFLLTSKDFISGPFHKKRFYHTPFSQGWQLFILFCLRKHLSDGYLLPLPLLISPEPHGRVSGDQLLITMTTFPVIVDNAAGLEVGIDSDTAKVLKASLL